jgi:recombination protein RecT
LIDLARRSGGIDSISAYVVRENETFYYEITQNGPNLRHVPADDDSPARLFYAIAHIKGTMIPQVEVMTLKQVQAIRARSRAKDSGPWVTDFEEMARKTVVRRLVKYLPKSAELAKAVALEDKAEGGDDVDLISLEEDIPTEAAPSRTDEVKAALQATAREPGEEG